MLEKRRFPSTKSETLRWRCSTSIYYTGLKCTEKCGDSARTDSTAVWCWDHMMAMRVQLRSGVWDVYQQKLPNALPLPASVWWVMVEHRFCKCCELPPFASLHFSHSSSVSPAHSGHPYSRSIFLVPLLWILLITVCYKLLISFKNFFKMVSIPADFPTKFCSS